MMWVILSFSLLSHALNRRCATASHRKTVIYIDTSLKDHGNYTAISTISVELTKTWTTTLTTRHTCATKYSYEWRCSLNTWTMLLFLSVLSRDAGKHNCINYLKRSFTSGLLMASEWPWSIQPKRHKNPPLYSWTLFCIAANIL